MKNKLDEKQMLAILDDLYDKVLLIRWFVTKLIKPVADTLVRH